MKPGVKLPLMLVGVLAGGMALTLVAGGAPLLGPAGAWTPARLAALGLILAGGAAIGWATAHRLLARVRRLMRDLAASEDGPAAADRPAGDELQALAHRVAGVLNRHREEAQRLRAHAEALEVRLRIAAMEKRQTEAILNSLASPVLVTNAYDEVVAANPAAQHVLGFRLEEGARLALAEAVRHPKLAELIRSARQHRVRAAGGTEVLAFGQEGAERYYRPAISSVVDADERITGVTAVLQDVTADRQMEKTKTEFVSAVSHELKAPLASIKAYVEMLADGEARDETTRQEFCRIIEMQTDRLSRLIQNLLSLSRIEAGVIKIAKEPVSLSQIVADAVEVMRPSAEEKDLALTVALSSVYAGVYADRDMLSQAVINLISNAIKYTPRGGRIAVRTQVTDDMALCEVSDTGLGIGPEDLPRIFEKFYRVKANSQAAPGTGLGLALVKRIIEEIHGGRIEVASQVGQGSTFRFTLPLRAPSASAVRL